MATSPDKLPQIIADLHQRVAEIERRGRNRRRTGTIEEGPNEDGKYRVKIGGTEDEPYITGWIKARTVAAGNVKIDAIYKAGEQVDVTSESGDMTDALIDFSTYSTENARENTDTPLHIKIVGNGQIITTGDVLLNVEGNVNATVGGTFDVVAGAGHLH